MGDANDISDSLADIVSHFVAKTGGLIAALRAVQAKIGRLPPEIDEIAARAFNLSRAEVKGVISFYSDFTRAPARGAAVRLCAAEACQAQGGRDLERALCRHFAIKPGETSASDDLTLEHVYCLGLCSAGPAAIVDGKLMARAAPEAIIAAVAESGRVPK